MNNQEIEIIDWKYIRQNVAQGLETFWGWYLAVVVFIIPLLIVTYGWPAPVIRQLAFFVLVGLGWLGWLVRLLLAKEPIIWQRSALGWGALFVVLAALISSFTASDPAAVWGLRGMLADSSPLAWLGIAGLALLIVQEAGRAERNSERLLFAYLFSSSLLALFVISWWIFKQELITPAFGLFSTAALWFAINALVLGAASLLVSGKARLAALILIGAHIVVLFGYDYDLAWYALAGGGVLLSVGQLLLEERLCRVDYRLSFGLVIVSVALLFAPAKALSPRLGFDSQSAPVVSSKVIWPRYYQNIIKSDPVFGVGLGRAGESFWNLAEMVDMRQVRQFPNLGNGYLVILWEGGMFLFGAFIFWMFCLIRSLLGFKTLGLKTSLVRLGLKTSLVRLGFKTQPVLLLASALALAGLLSSFAVGPVDFMFLFSLGVFAGLAGAALKRNQAQISRQKGARSFLIFGAVILAALLTAVIFFSFRDGAGRLDFLSSINTDKTGTSLDLERMNRAIDKYGRIYGYRLARIDFYTQALREAITNNPDFKPEQLEPYLSVLKPDFAALAQAKLTGRELWLLAWNAEQIGALWRSLPKAEGQTEDKGKEWFVRARALYESGLAELPRNVIMFTDVARFYRMRGADILKEGETAAALFSQAYALLDRVTAIDNTYEPLFGERAELLSAEGKSEEAFESLKPLAEQNPVALYSVGHLALAAKKLSEAVLYFKKAIEQNPNHLQARYELIQAYLALSDNAAASAELAALSERAPQDDAATQGLLKGLKELIK